LDLQRISIFRTTEDKAVGQGSTFSIEDSDLRNAFWQDIAGKGEMLEILCLERR
jgi:hypothetical protein